MIRSALIMNVNCLNLCVATGFATLSPVTERAKKGDGFMDRVRKQTSNRVAGMIQAGERGSEGLMNMMNQTDGGTLLFAVWVVQF